jgi:hypothetical protein
MTSLHEVIRFRHARQVAELYRRLKVAAQGLQPHDTTGPDIYGQPGRHLPTNREYVYAGTSQAAQSG